MTNRSTPRRKSLCISSDGRIDFDGCGTTARLGFAPGDVFFLDEVEHSETTFDDIEPSVEVTEPGMSAADD